MKNTDVPAVQYHPVDNVRAEETRKYAEHGPTCYPNGLSLKQHEEENKCKASTSQKKIIYDLLRNGIKK